MNIIEFLDLPAEEKREYCVSHGLVSHRDFSKFSSYKDSLSEFCKALELDKGYITHMYCLDSGSYCIIDFSFSFPFQSHVDRSMPRSRGDEITICIEGTNKNTLKISSPSIKEQIYIWNQKNNFFDERDNYNNFIFTIYTKNKKLVADTIKSIEQRANAYFPHIEYCLSTFEDGSFEKAYNMIHIQNKFKVGHTIMESFNANVYIEIRYEAFNDFKVNLHILDCMLIWQYLVGNKLAVNAIKNYNLAELLKICKEKYLINDTATANKKKIEDASIEFKERLNNVVKELSEKYGIHESYFIGTDWCKIKMPTNLNNVDLMKHV
ncbi:MAG: hypothetical protein [Wendovervirus sonii]|uniref:Uncharacterized protein n=1 Tax=phage Lak_Megaphage_Sonny TaxID=3109229 RepID=A0ABZ0Z2C6_9CAUD|nr:MAG: hypothetical protein [phage Lak_Megaphage_Sonny]